MWPKLNGRAVSCWASLVCLSATACSLDDRTLHHDAASGASAGSHPGASGSGAGTVAGSGGASAGTGTDGGNAGSGEPNPNGGSGAAAQSPLVNGCADLDSDGVADCTVTLLKNPSFTTDVASWAGVDGATLTWDSDNALADTPSGCARLRPDDAVNSSESVYRAVQCVAVPSGQIVIAWANARVDKTPAGGQTVHAELEVSYFDSQDCSGKSTGYFATPPSQASTDWVIVQAGGPSAATTKSVSVALVGIRPDASNQQSICFDNVMVKALPL